MDTAKTLTLDSSAREQLVKEIISDSVIFLKVADGIHETLSAYSKGGHSFEPEGQYGGYANAYVLMGINPNEEQKANLLHSIFNGYFSRMDEYRCNASELADKIYDDWYTAIN
nr:hypothetical protein [uncultured Allomuricauda sp.]